MHANNRCCPWCMHCVQVRQLVLDPAIQQEFGRLRRELEEQRSTISQLKEQNDSLTFTAVRLERGLRLAPGVVCVCVVYYVHVALRCVFRGGTSNSTMRQLLQPARRSKQG